jgi:hypothetical protein
MSRNNQQSQKSVSRSETLKSSTGHLFWSNPDFQIDFFIKRNLICILEWVGIMDGRKTLTVSGFVEGGGEVDKAFYLSQV